MGNDPLSDFEGTERLDQVVKECCEALDHLRKAIDHADKSDPFLLKLVSTMRRVASIADDVIASQEKGEAPPPPEQKTTRSA